MPRKLITTALLMFVYAIALARPAVAQTPVACEAPQVHATATIGMIADVVRNIGGACVEVTAMMGPGVDPHLYVATARDVELLFETDMIFYGGLNLESRMIDVFEQIETGLNKPVVAVSETVPAEDIHMEPGTDVPDPHLWMDVGHWMHAAEAIRDALVTVLPEHAEYITANAEAYLAEMQALDTYVREQIARIPEQQRLLVTAHDAFQYYSHGYGIEVYAPQGITTAAEAGVEDIRATIDLLVERQVPAIFVETSVSPDIVEAIQAGAQARGLNVVIGGYLYSDALGEEGTLEGTYLGMIRHNTDTIVAALTGAAQEE